jgi:small subunit ribosomal protein S20
MPNIKSAKARVKTNRRDESKNRNYKSELKSLIKEVRTAIEAKDAKSPEMISRTVSRIDSAVSKGIIKKRTANRKKARLLTLANKTKA